MSPTDVARGSTGRTATPLRVFLSHTSDLGKHTESGTFVAAAVEAVLRARHAVTDMAYFGARDTSPSTTCIDMVAQSDVYVGIIGLRYGSPVRDRPEISYTELEFEAAGEHCQPRLIFLIRDDSTHVVPAGEPPERRARQDAFRRGLLDSGLTVIRVSTPAELELAIYQALVELGPSTDAPARLAEAQALLASMPTDVVLPRAPLPAGSRMALAPNPLFVGRGDELLRVARALRGADTTVALGQVVASTGLGGLGKTQMAVELVHRYGRFFAGGVFWLSFASADEIPLQVAACGAREFDSLSLEQRVQRVKDAWQGALPRLLIFDNCEEESLLAAWRPPSGGRRVLVTSRRSHWLPTLGVTVLPLDVLPRTDSTELLRRYRPDLAPNDPWLGAIADKLGDLPLALHLAGRYLHNYHAEVSLDDYLAELDQPAVIRHASLLGEGLEDSPSPTNHVQSLAQTFALCLSRLDRERDVDRVAIAMLARMARMAPGEAVPRDLLGRTLEDVGPLQRADGLRRLGAAGLVEEGDGWLRLHRLLVHFVRQEELDPQARAAVDRVLIECGEAAEKARLTGRTLAWVIPHLVDAASSETGDDERMARLCSAAGLALYHAGEFHAALQWLERALAINERILGSDHLETAKSMSRLDTLLWERGELAAARPLRERVLAIRERLLGFHHPDTAQSLNNLGGLLREQGELVAARPLHERALAIRELVLGPDHPDVAESLNGLALLLEAQGELTAARALYERALTIWETAYGPDHRDTASILNNLSIVLRKQGELAAARRLIERAVSAGERADGPDHPQVAYYLNNLALILQEQCDVVAAKVIFERALAIRERALPSDHPLTARSLDNLAGLLRRQGQTGEAEPLSARALAIRERILGLDHPDTATSVHNHALLRRARGDLAAARPLFERALAIRERALGPDHPDTVATRRALGELAAEGDRPAADGGPSEDG